MNLKLKITARTPYSQEFAIYDADNKDANDQAINIGKLDVHYADDQIIGTLLIWEEYATGFNRMHGPGSDVTMDTLIDEILSEVSEPMGVPGEYAIQVYYPSITNHYFVSNYADEEETDATHDEYAATGEEGEYADEYAEEEPTEEEQAQQDDFARKLRERT
jgi:hypothetical protein